MGDLLLFASVSVDGYAAGLGDDLSRLHRWMDREDGEGGHQDPFVESFRSAGAVVLGRRTYDLGQEPWGDDDVFESPVLVVTHERREPLDRNGTTFTFTGGSPGDVVAVARALAGDRHIVVMGSPGVGQQLLAAGLVEAVMLHQVPVLLGGGIPLFGPLRDHLELVPELMRPGPEVSLLRFAVAT
jgi:dihydrofolate reductase